MADVTFSWNGTDIKSFAAVGAKITIRDYSFPLRKAITRHKVRIPGRPGSWDFGGGVEEDYHIRIVIAIIGDDVDHIMNTAETLEAAFASKGELVLSFMPTVIHHAMIYDEIPMDLEGPGGVAAIELNFECDAEQGEVEGS